MKAAWLVVGMLAQQEVLAPKREACDYWTMSASYLWRGEFNNEALNALHSEAFRHANSNDDWWAQVNQHSLGWVCAYYGEVLIGFLNVVWDGGVHAFILDVMVATRAQEQSIGTEMVSIAVREARKAGCEWLHVDFEDHLRHYYFDKCGFKPTNAGLIKL
jgi:GNAT superfamily N-acetyltransferase